jgi:hypothetical protein
LDAVRLRCGKFVGTGCDKCSMQVVMHGHLHSLVGRPEVLLIAPCVTFGLSPFRRRSRGVRLIRNFMYSTSSVLLFWHARSISTHLRNIIKQLRLTHWGPEAPLGSGQPIRGAGSNLCHEQHQMSSLIIRGQHASRYISDPPHQYVIHPRHNPR